MNVVGFSILKYLTIFIPQLIILSACIYYLVKKFSIEGLLLTIGAIVGLLFTIFSIIVLPYLCQKNIIDPIFGQMKIMSIIGPVNFIASIAFAIGFFMLICKMLLKKKEVLY